MKFTVGHLLLIMVSTLFLINNCSKPKKVESSKEPVTSVSPIPGSSSVSKEFSQSSSKTVKKEEVVCAYKSDEAAQEFVSNVKSNFNTTDVDIEAKGNCVVYKWYK